MQELLVLGGEGGGVVLAGEVEVAEHLVVDVDRHAEHPGGRRFGPAGADLGEAVLPGVRGAERRVPCAGQLGGAVHDVLERGAQFELGTDAQHRFEQPGEVGDAVTRAGRARAQVVASGSRTSGSILPSSM